MPAARKCSECGKPLVDAAGKPKPSGTKTCSQSCRQKRARRLKSASSRGGKASPHAPEVQTMAAVVRDDMKDVAHEVMKEELAPVVRESLTADVLDAIADLVKLTPTAIARLQADLDNADDTIRQRAYTLLLKYTMGNPSVAPPPAQQQPAALSVVFNVPRPGDGPADTTPAGGAEQVDSVAEELRICGDCHEQKPASQFVAGSERCQSCFDRIQGMLAARFNKGG